MTIERAWTLVTVTYNSADTLARYWQSERPDQVVWIVVDNASSDETVRVAQELGAHVVPLDTNLGFSKANNIGLAEARSKYIAFVNPDVTVDYASLNTMSRMLDEQEVLLAPQLMNPDGSRQPSARGLPFLFDKLAHRGLRLPRANLHRYLPQPTEPTYIAWAMGAAIAGRRSTLLRLHGWDDKYFMYYEDHDLGLRAWAAGVPVIALPDVRWIHEWARETASLNASPWRREVRSALRFFASYPEFLLPLTRLARRRHPELARWNNHAYRSEEAPGRAT